MKAMHQEILANFIGKKIQEMREGRGIKQEELAQQVKVSRASISNLERGKHVPTLPLLYQICNALSVDTPDILPRQEQVFPGTKSTEEVQTPVADDILLSLRKKYDDAK